MAFTARPWLRREFEEDAEAKRPTVQVGDPFTEKLLIEACLELMATDAIVAIQDMGAAGLTSSSVEMATNGKAGIRLDMNKVPCREEGMTPYEMMLSESQERMLMVLKPGQRGDGRRRSSRNGNSISPSSAKSPTRGIWCSNSTAKWCAIFRSALSPLMRLNMTGPISLRRNTPLGLASATDEECAGNPMIPERTCLKLLASPAISPHAAGLPSNMIAR